jgi:hypothetical protein
LGKFLRNQIPGIHMASMNFPQANVTAIRSIVSFLLTIAAQCSMRANAGDVTPSPPGKSPAHEASKGLSPDPLYNAASEQPAVQTPSNPALWIYGHAQLEAWKIDQIVKEGFMVHKRIGYTRNYVKVQQVMHFRHAWPSVLERKFKLRALGEVTVKDGKSVLFKGTCYNEPTQVSLPDKPLGFVEIALVGGTAGEPVAISIPDGPLHSGEGWEWSVDGTIWAPADTFPSDRTGLPPHLQREPVMVVRPKSVSGDVYDFGYPLAGRPVFRAEGTPAIFPGETAEEALAPIDSSDVNYKLERRSDGLWTFPYTTGLRFLRIQGEKVSDVAVEASFHPVCYRGAFACSDEKLTRMWLHGAYTLRLCMDRMVLDGIKRDRMPWIGDLAAVLSADAYAFADQEIIRQTFTALGHPVKGAVNGIADYSLWLVIGHAIYQRYFDDMPYLRRELPCLNRFMEELAKHNDAEGMLHPEGSVFIDWGYGNAKVRFSSAMQIMWYWAQVSMAEMNTKAGETAKAQRWQKSAEALARVVQAKVWLATAGSMTDCLEVQGAKTPYPDFLAVLSGFAKPEQMQPILKYLTKYPSRGTPFMKAYELQAITELGNPDLTISRIREYWGGMMNAGAVTFWENYREDEKNHTAMYGRPFARSLCHGWSCGPTSLLPQAILGVKPISDGWREFTLAPHLGDLAWAKATIPTPKGAIEISSKPHSSTVVIPKGLTLIAGGKRFEGPQVVAIQD